MKVSELIEMLKHCDPNAEVIRAGGEDDDYLSPVESVDAAFVVIAGDLVETAATEADAVWRAREIQREAPNSAARGGKGVVIR